MILSEPVPNSTVRWPMKCLKKDVQYVQRDMLRKNTCYVYIIELWTRRQLKLKKHSKLIYSNFICCFFFLKFFFSLRWNLLKFRTFISFAIFYSFIRSSQTNNNNKCTDNKYYYFIFYDFEILFATISSFSFFSFPCHLPTFAPFISNQTIMVIKLSQLAIFEFWFNRYEQWTRYIQYSSKWNFKYFFKLNFSMETRDYNCFVIDL